MELIEWIKLILSLSPGTQNIQDMVVVVTEIAGAVPERQYNVNVTGNTVGGDPVNFNYVTTKQDSITEETDAAARSARYENLAVQATLEEDIAEKANDEINDLEPDPLPPAP